ncbi:50S ribosomal protein L21 [Candidatus Wolfebacteria bacterium]|nr:50S ribosomal protein L21 [Candidatus Wolfebacteria bacterium]
MAGREQSAGALFAVIETGGKQYQVKEEQVITIEKLSGTIKTGDVVVFDKVLLVDNGKDTQIGDPYLKGAKVEGTLEEEGRGKKIRVLRYKAKSRYLKQKGHRQPFIKVKITAIK